MKSRRYDRLIARYLSYGLNVEESVIVANAVVAKRPTYGLMRSMGVPLKRDRKEKYYARKSRTDD